MNQISGQFNFYLNVVLALYVSVANVVLGTSYPVVLLTSLMYFLLYASFFVFWAIREPFVVRLTPFDLLFLILCQYLVLSTVIQYSLNSDFMVLSEGFKIVATNVIFYLIGRNILEIINQPSSIVYFTWLGIGLLLLLLGVVFGTATRLLYVFGNDVSYQLIGKLYLVLSIIIFFKSRSSAHLLFSLLALLLIGARTEFVVLLVVLVAYGLKTIRGTVLGFGLLFLTTLILYFNFELLGNNRFLELLDLANSDSVQARLSLTKENILSIDDRIILGDIQQQLENSQKASYPHNLLSAWTIFGFLGFVAYISLITLGFFQVCFRSDRSFGSLVLPVYLGVVLATIVSKSIMWPVLPFLFGLIGGQVENKGHRHTYLS